MSEQVADAVLNALAVRITKVLPAQIRTCLEQLTDEEIWSRPNEQSNSAGNLVLHLTGSINHFLNHKIGGMDFARDRDAEFAERRRIPKQELLAAFNAMVAGTEKTLGTLTSSALSSPSPEPKMNTILVEDLINVAIHLSTHTGQILWITKMFRGGGLQEVWMKTHRELGAWRK